jgi:hypothetical protein
MTSLLKIVCLLTLSAVTLLADAGRVLKVLPQFLDKDGHATTAPSLYERDAYQAWLRKNPSEISGLRFQVHWKSEVNSPNLRLRLDVRGSKGDAVIPTRVEVPVKRGRFSRAWSSVVLTPEFLAQSGEISAWRVSLLDGDKELAEQKSFLWAPR